MSSEQLNLEVVEIVRNWNDLGKRGKYERRLHELGPTAVETLLVLARQEVKTRKKRQRQGLCIIIVYGITILLQVIFRMIVPKPQFIELLSWIRVLCIFIFFYVFSQSLRGRAAAILANFSDVRAVGPLVESWHLSEESRVAITNTLLHLFPQMKPSDAQILTRSQRKALHQILSNSRDETLLLTILKALEQIGDSAALPYVERLAAPLDEAAVSAKVQKAAQECLPFLQERAQQERDSTTLLRAAEGTNGNAGELLRPVSADTKTDSRDLLRATQQE